MSEYRFKQKAPVIQAILDKAAELPTKQELDSEFANTRGMVDTTYAQLVALRDAGELVPGRLYRITDFVTTVKEEESLFTGEVMTRSAGHAYDVVVLALSGSVLDENALAMVHEGDTYFANSKLEAWQLKYCLDNDTDRFRWADDVNGKGVVFYMKDEFGNEAPFDFKNVQYKRFTVKTGVYVYVSPYALGNYKTNTYYQSLFDNKESVPQYGNRAPWVHEYYGYRSEQYLYDNDEATWQDGPNPQNGGKRIFVKLYSPEDVELLVEVENPEWYYTFSKKNANADTPSDRSLEGSIENVTLLIRNKNLPHNVFLTGVNNSLISGTQNTFGSVFNSTVRGSSNCAPSVEFSTLGPLAVVCADDIDSCTISGSVVDLLVGGSLSRTTITGRVSQLHIERDMVDTEISGRIDNTWMGYDVENCVFGRCSMTGCEIECDNAFIYTSVEGVFNGNTFAFDDRLDGTDQSWMLINVNSTPELVSVSSLFDQK